MRPIHSWILLLLLPCMAAAEDPVQQDYSGFHNREILLGLFQATSGFDWTDSTNWFQQRSDVCNWKGVTCYTQFESDERRNGQIQQINLRKNNLKGTLPAMIFEIPFLETIDVDDNPDLDIDFSGIDKAQFLKELSMSGTDVKDLSNIGAAPKLENLHMTDTGFRGKLPSGLFQLTELVAFYANGNSFTGTIPTSIGGLSNLDELYLYDSELTGQIPTEFGLLTGLEILALSQNAFGGTLPSELNRMTNLQLLSIQREDGKEKGTGIFGPVPAFDNHRKLTALYLQNQALTDNLDQSFLANCPAAEKVEVNLQNNNISGTLPLSVAEKQYLTLNLANNQITSVPTEIYDTVNNLCPKISGWMDGQVAKVGCNGFLCPPGTWAPDGHATADNACRSCNKRIGVVGGSSQPWGATECDGVTTPDSALGLLLTLGEFYKDMGGENWKNDDGWLQDSISVPVCDWYGITCDEFSSIQSINLRNNGLTGTFSTSDIFTIPNLRIINLSANSIDLDLTDIGNAKNLQVLDLSSTKLKLSALDALIELTEEPTITMLSLDSNDLGGSIPSAIFALTSLEELKISHTGFSGTLSSDIGRLTNLQRLECSGNDLTGQLPAAIGNLRSLQEFLAGENAFGGTLPTQLNQLTELRSLELQQVIASGGIDGPLPAYERLRQLTSLKVDSNQLTGNLPADFLANSVKADFRIEIGLSHNQLEGAIPSSWSRFNNFFVNLVGNKITEIPNELCNIDSWMDGDVGKYQCDAILCPKGKANAIGRRSNDQSVCNNCDGGDYFGATTCGGNFGAEGFGSGNFAAANPDDVTVLSELFSSTGGTSWNRKTGWGDTADYCNWYGVECDGGKRVVSIDLAENNLKGTVPSSIYELEHLRSLRLYNNEVAFTFVGIEKAPLLESLDLGEINLKSMNGISGASQLKTLRLNGNNLDGAFPPSLYQLTSLQELDLGSNNLDGKVPNAIAALTGLTVLRLYQNAFTGRIPAALGDLTGLKELNMAENNFEGTVPQSLNDLSNLKYLSLQREGGITGTDVGLVSGVSSAVGPGLTGPVPSLKGLKSISELYLGSNSLSGSIPFDFLDGVEFKTELIKIDLTSNQISGTLPGSLSQFDKLDIFVANNEISGIADALCGKSDWMDGDVGKFNCDGLLCPADKYAPFVGRKQDISNPCQGCATGTDGVWGSTECLTDQEKKEGKQRNILENFYRACNGDLWLHDDGWLDPDVSICDWYGIKCESNENPSVVSIELQSNNLEGTLPSAIYTLPTLKVLNLQGNLWFDVTFDGIGSATSLETLDLEEMRLFDVMGVGAAKSLKRLRIGRNELDIIPDELFDLTNLEILDMSDNPFKENSMAIKFQLLSKLTYLGCASCGFTGEVPSYLGSMTTLEYIDLGRNGFSGQVPNVSQLTELRHLDLSDQVANGFGLHGEVPAFLEQTQLTELYLQNNDLVGAVTPTLLQNVVTNGLVTIDLRSNALTGVVPTELSRFDFLNLFLAGNQIGELPDSLCNKNNWNDGNVATLQCDAILCPTGKFNSYGRAFGTLTCSDCDEASFMGQTYCGTAIEKAALVEFYRDLNGANWTVDENWLRTDDYCTWAGITCHEDGQYKGLVKEINLADNWMKGIVPQYMWIQLEGLQVFNVQKNSLTLNFQNVQGARILETVMVSETDTYALDGIGGAFGSLRNLHVTNAALAGPIPNEVFALTRLQNLYLSHNELSGTISSNVGRLTNLENLYIFDNKMTGTLPPELGSVGSLKALSLGENLLTGSIPRQISGLPLLEILSLQKEEPPPCLGFICEPSGSHGLTGTVPSLHSLPRIKEIYLGHNRFTGTLPPNFLSGVTDKSQQLFVDLSFNAIEGRIPPQLKDFDDLQLLLSSNLIDEIPDELCNKNKWFNGEIANGCDAFLCPEGTFNEFGRRVDSKTPCETCTYPASATLFGSTECGPVLVDFMSQREKLMQLYDSTNGLYWKISDGWGKDQVDECDWYGIECEVTALGTKEVTEINLAGNDLFGIIPSVLYHLPDLRKLDVRFNHVELQFFAIWRSSALEELLLDFTATTTLDGIGRATALKKLHLPDCPLGWKPIPEELYTLGLEDLDLSNSMVTGTLSSAIGSMTMLKHLALESNALSGEIPSEIGLLNSLEELVLSSNDWMGQLPDMSGMTSLRGLYVDNTEGEGAGLTGSLPAFSNMPKLSEIHLQDNQFTGSISENFLAQTNTSYTINAHLNKNALVGTIPSVLSRFREMNIYLADNLITAIGNGLCDKSQWMRGTVGSYQCDAILCPPGQFSVSGRRESDSIFCEPCPGAEDSKIFGKSFCLEYEKEREKTVLEKLFEETGGMSWRNRDRWNDEGFDYCTWHGISCTPDNLVQEIVLGSNNLVGTLPIEIYEFSKLKNLWLYSNLIDVSFQGIGKATNLESLILDSTKITSLFGIGKAVSLKELDIRFNNLKGPFPAEIDQLYNLESLLCSDNDFTGTVPNLYPLRNLKKLRMGSNEFSGPMPSFSTHQSLETVELAHNQITGTIPPTMFNVALYNMSMYLDVSDNSLTGGIPADLARFSDMTILLRNNQIDEIPPALCNLNEWNSGDVEAFGCDGLLCPPGSASQMGRASRKQDSECVSCPSTKSFGQTACSLSSGITTLSWLAATTTLIMSLCWL
ncbi:unnamed protein product [Cylindrotheca closterium]|uniref:Leucine-rich repeat-containing N-terminal plant-type domain-containing protein n=1 Tax=Cylindrotheca closterium TaxID=2856 RepID=A0AAD2CR59_9STRA|nr:unnamed protein product [Cylindrotheca closterium]